MSRFDGVETDQSTVTIGTIVREQIKQALAFGLRGLMITGLIAILFEELLPEPVAKPIVVLTVVLNLGFHVWAWRKIRRWHK